MAPSNPQTDALRPAVDRFVTHLVAERRSSPHTTSAYTSDLEQLADLVDERHLMKLARRRAGS